MLQPLYDFTQHPSNLQEPENTYFSLATQGCLGVNNWSLDVCD